MDIKVKTLQNPTLRRRERKDAKKNRKDGRKDEKMRMLTLIKDKSLQNQILSDPSSRLILSFAPWR